MVTNGSPRSLASWDEEPTTADAIVAALAELWLGAARQTPPTGSDRPDESGIVRTRVLNFLAYVETQGVAERVAAAMTRIAGTHPSRSIVAFAQRGQPNSSLGGSLRAQCHAPAGSGRLLCCDQVELRAAGAAAEHLPQIVNRLLIHDLPTLLWWPGDPPLDEPQFTSMAAVSDLVIVDSSEFGEPERQLRTLARFARSARGNPAVADLNWDRVVEWREVVAQFFDDPSCRWFLDGITTVEITFVPDPYRRGIPAQALLVAGWLGSRLGWEPAVTQAAGLPLTIGMRHGDRPVTVRFQEGSAETGPPGTVLALGLEAARDGRRGSFSVAAQENATHGTSTATIGDGNPIVRGFLLERPAESRLLSEEIESLGVDRALPQALDLAVRMLAPSEG